MKQVSAGQHLHLSGDLKSNVSVAAQQGVFFSQQQQQNSQTGSQTHQGVNAGAGVGATAGGNNAAGGNQQQTPNQNSQSKYDFIFVYCQFMARCR